MVISWDESLSTGFCIDPRQGFFFFLSVAKVLYALVPLTWLSDQTETLWSFCGGCRTAKGEVLLLQKLLLRLFVSDRTAASPDVDSWPGRRMPVPVQASVLGWLLCLYTEKERRWFLPSRPSEDKAETVCVVLFLLITIICLFAKHLLYPWKAS